jgi:predicted ABC-type ATPase
LSDKQLWLLAGGNGAGKSSFYRTQLKPLGIPFINADLIAQELFPDAPEAHSYEAASLAEDLRYRLLTEGRTFCFETVFSHPSKIDFMANAKALSYEVILVFIHLSTPELNKARISQRIKEGGHFVPDEKVENRIPRTLSHIRTAIALADECYLLDNSSAHSPFEQVANLRHGTLSIQQPHLPEWARYLLEN